MKDEIDELIKTEGFSVDELIIKDLQDKIKYHECFINHLKKDKLDLQQENKQLTSILTELEEELEREIEFGNRITKEENNYNSCIDIKNTLIKVLNRINELKEKYK